MNLLTLFFKRRRRSNSLLAIHPYWHGGTWVFDDLRVGLYQEPFVAGADDIITTAVEEAGVEYAREGFRLTFSAEPFPGATLRLKRQDREHGGYWYVNEATGQRGWLCPATLHYFDKHPLELHAKFETL
jgi:hypothetical protein